MGELMVGRKEQAPPLEPDQRSAAWFFLKRLFVAKGGVLTIKGGALVYLVGGGKTMKAPEPQPARKGPSRKLNAWGVGFIVIDGICFWEKRGVKEDAVENMPGPPGDCRGREGRVGMKKKKQTRMFLVLGKSRSGGYVRKKAKFGGGWRVSRGGVMGSPRR